MPTVPIAESTIPPDNISSKTLTEIEQVVEQLLGSDTVPVAVGYLPGGYSNRNFHIRVGSTDYALRISRNPPSNPTAEKTFLQTPMSPRLVAYDSQTGHMLTKWVEGQLLARVGLSPSGAATYLRELHAGIPQGVRVYDLVEQVSLLLDRGLPAAGIRELFDALRWRPLSVSGCHNDLNPWNIIHGENLLYTLDWEYAGDNEPLFDIVTMCLGLGFTDAQMEECIASYYPVPPSPDYVLKTCIAFYCREHAWAVAQVSDGNDRQEILDQARDSAHAAIDLARQRSW